MLTLTASIIISTHVNGSDNYVAVAKLAQSTFVYANFDIKTYFRLSLMKTQTIKEIVVVWVQIENIVIGAN